MTDARRSQAGHGLRGRAGICALAGIALAGPAQTAPLGPLGLPWVQLALLGVALFLSWLVWHLVTKRREQEVRLMDQIREREARLNLALWGSGDEFWDWNIRENSLYRLGANQLFGQGSLETMSTDEWRNNSVHPDDLPRVQKLLQEHIVGHADIYDSEHRIRGANGDWDRRIGKTQK